MSDMQYATTIIGCTDKITGCSEPSQFTLYCQRFSGQLTQNPDSKYFILYFTVGYPKKNSLNILDPPDAVIEIAPLECK
jgi:hypothetical protein